jgi:hypothetical protein
MTLIFITFVFMFVQSYRARAMDRTALAHSAETYKKRGNLVRQRSSVANMVDVEAETK